MILLVLFQLVSQVQNGIQFWFNRKMIRETLDREYDFNELETIIKEYEDMLNGVRKMELFSGDPTVREFYRQTQETKELLREFREIYFEVKNEEEDEKEDFTRQT